MSEYITVLSKLGRKIRTSISYWKIITNIKHPVMAGQEQAVKDTLVKPDIVRQSDKDNKVLLYYRKSGKRDICVVTRHENGTGYIISVYPVDKIKKGLTVYEKNQSVS